MNTATLRAKFDDESVVLPPEGFDFFSQLEVGDSLVSAVVTAELHSGTDPAPSAILSGSPSIVNETNVQQSFTGGVIGCIYLITVTAVSAHGGTYTRTGYLAVVERTTTSSGFIWYGVRLPWIIGGWL